MHSHQIIKCYSIYSEDSLNEFFIEGRFYSVVSIKELKDKKDFITAEVKDERGSIHHIPLKKDSRKNEYFGRIQIHGREGTIKEVITFSYLESQEYNNLQYVFHKEICREDTENIGLISPSNYNPKVLEPSNPLSDTFKDEIKNNPVKGVIMLDSFLNPTKDISNAKLIYSYIKTYEKLEFLTEREKSEVIEFSLPSLEDVKACSSHLNSFAEINLTKTLQHSDSVQASSMEKSLLKIGKDLQEALNLMGCHGSVKLNKRANEVGIYITPARKITVNSVEGKALMQSIFALDKKFSCSNEVSASLVCALPYIKKLHQQKG